MFLFSPLDEADLVAHGLLSKPTKQGWRNIHRRLTNGFGEAEHADIPLLPIRYLSEMGIDGIESVPDRMVSEATLKYVGFRSEVARYLWSSWLKWDARRSPKTNFYQVDEFSKHNTLIDMTFAHYTTIFVRQRTEYFNPRSSEPRSHWYQCLEMCGFDDDFTNFVMNPFFDVIRLDESCLFWIITTLDMRFRFLRSVQHTSWLRNRELRSLNAQGLWKPPKITVVDKRKSSEQPKNSKNDSGARSGKSQARRRKKKSISARRRVRPVDRAPAVNLNKEVTSLNDLCDPESSTGSALTPDGSDSGPVHWTVEMKALLAEMLREREKQAAVEEGRKGIPPRPH